MASWGQETTPKDYASSWTLKYAGVILFVGATGAVLIAVASLTFLPERWGSASVEDAPQLTEAQQEEATPEELLALSEQQLAVDVAKNDAEAEVRDLGLRIALGFGVISGALVAYGRLQLTRAESERSDKASARSDKGQANERWTTAVEQLGSEHVEVRLGGVYALQHFYDDMADVPDERLRTTSVLAAFVRANLPPNKPLPDIPEDRRPAPLPPDIQAALTVLEGLADRPPTDLSRIDTSLDARYRADLFGANLSGAKLSGANLSGAILSGADLSGADLSGADLSGAWLLSANLTRADLIAANLTGAKLSAANMTEASLSGADLTDAILWTANLTGATLTAQMIGANLSGANLSMANLSGAILWTANLTGANLSRANLTGANLTDATGRTDWDELIERGAIRNPDAASGDDEQQP